MTLSELKAWIDGLQVGLSGNPITPDQWEALKAKLASVTVEPTAPVDPVA